MQTLREGPIRLHKGKKITVRHGILKEDSLELYKDAEAHGRGDDPRGVLEFRDVRRSELRGGQLLVLELQESEDLRGEIALSLPEDTVNDGIIEWAREIQARLPQEAIVSPLSHDEQPSSPKEMLGSPRSPDSGVDRQERASCLRSTVKELKDKLRDLKDRSTSGHRPGVASNCSGGGDHREAKSGACSDVASVAGQVPALTIAEERWKRRAAREKSIADSIREQRRRVELAVLDLANGRETLLKASVRIATQRNEQRLLLREKRPQRELVRDTLQKALEAERNALAELSARWDAQLQESQDCYNVLLQIKSEIDSCFLKLHLDTGNKPYHLLDQAQAAVDAACRSRAECMKAFDTINSSVERIGNTTNAILRRHADEVTEMKRRLEVEQKDVKSAIAAAEKRAERLRWLCGPTRHAATAAARPRAARSGHDGEEAAARDEAEDGLGSPKRSALATNFVTLKAKLKASAYSQGVQADVILKRMSKDDTGALHESEFKNVLRRQFKVPPSVATDAELLALAAHLSHGCGRGGRVTINDFVTFMTADAQVYEARLKTASQLVEDLKSMQEMLLVDMRSKTAALRIADAMRNLKLSSGGPLSDKGADAVDRYLAKMDETSSRADPQVKAETNGCAESKPSVSTDPAYSPSSTASTATGGGDEAADARTAAAVAHGGAEVAASPALAAAGATIPPSGELLNESKRLRTMLEQLESTIQEESALSGADAAAVKRGTSHAANRQKMRAAREQDVQAKIRECMNQLEEAILSLAKHLQIARQSKVWTCASINQKRLRLRAAGRPGNERPADELQKVLDHERQALAAGCQSLVNCSTPAQEILDTLLETKAELESQRLKLHLDRSKYPESLFEKIGSQLKSSKEIGERLTEVVNAREVEAQKLSSRSDTSLKRSLERQMAVKRELESELKDNDKTIAEMAKHLLKLQAEHSTAVAARRARQQRGEDVASGLARAKKPLTGPLAAKTRSAIKAVLSTQNFEDVFRRLNFDGSGQITETEFHSALRRTFKIPHSVLPDNEIVDLCRKLDTDRSGTLSIQDIRDFVYFLDIDALEEQMVTLEATLQELKAAHGELLEDLRSKMRQLKSDERCRVVDPVSFEAEKKDKGSRLRSMSVAFSPSPRRTEFSPRDGVASSGRSSPSSPAVSPGPYASAAAAPATKSRGASAPPSRWGER